MQHDGEFGPADDDDAAEGALPQLSPRMHKQLSGVAEAGEEEEEAAAAASDEEASDTNAAGAPPAPRPSPLRARWPLAVATALGWESGSSLNGPGPGTAPVGRHCRIGLGTGDRRDRLGCGIRPLLESFGSCHCHGVN